MKVNVMTVQADSGDIADAMTYIQVDGIYTIHVKGLGTGDFRLLIQGPAEDSLLEQFRREEFGQSLLEHLDEDGFYRGRDFGPALVWAEPITLAHVIMDLLNNQ